MFYIISSAAGWLVEFLSMISPQCLVVGQFAGIVLASRASGRLLDTKTLKEHPTGHSHSFVRNFFKCQSKA